MVDLEDVPIVGRLVAVGGVLADVLLNSGDLVLSLLLSVVGNFELLVPVVSVLSKLAGEVEWLPADLLEQALIASLVVMLVIYLGKFLAALGTKND